MRGWSQLPSEFPFPTSVSLLEIWRQFTCHKAGTLLRMPSDLPALSNNASNDRRAVISEFVEVCSRLFSAC